MGKDKTGWNKYRRGPKRTTSGDLTLTIDSLSHYGDGVARHNGQVVFVPLTLPGEYVRLKPTSHKKSYLRASVIEIIKPSPLRRQAPCEYFGQCGGCDWQHLPYEEQLKAKQQHLADVLQRIGKLQNVNIKSMIASEQQFHYRNRIQGVVKDGRFHFKQRASNTLVAIEQCAIAEPAINAALSNASHVNPTSSCTDTLQQPLPEGRVELSVNANGVSILPLNDNNTTEFGFRQVNTAVSTMMSELLHQVAQTHMTGQCIDLYCGRGSWSIDIAQQHPQTSVTGVDSSEQNIRIARTLAHDAKLNNLKFHQGQVEKLLHTLALPDSFCIVDPPRAGLDAKLCQALITHPAKTIIYISCHPATLARDMATLTQTCYSLESVTPLDMFPQTAHLETLSVLHRKSQP